MRQHVQEKAARTIVDVSRRKDEFEKTPGVPAFVRPFKMTPIEWYDHISVMFAGLGAE